MLKNELCSVNAGSIGEGIVQDPLEDSSRSFQDQDDIRPTSRLSMSMDLDISFRDKIRSKFKTALVITVNSNLYSL